MPEALPELFADGKCGKSLPAGELLQVFKFGHFSPVKGLVDSSEATVVVGKGRQPTGTSTGALTTRSVALIPLVGDNTRIDNRPDFTFKQLLVGETSITLPPEPASLKLTREQVADAVATGIVKYKNHNWVVVFTPDTIANLLNGSPTEAEGHSDKERLLFMLQPDASLVRRTASMSSVSEFEISERDLPDYLSKPWLPGQDDLPYDLKLDGSNVKELVQNGRTILQVDDREVGIKVTKHTADLGVIPGLGKLPYIYGDGKPPPLSGGVKDGTTTAPGFQPRP